MIKFNVISIANRVPGMYGKIMRERALRDDQTWHPKIWLTLMVEQEEETDQWTARIGWRWLDWRGEFPCREVGQSGIIARRDPPDRFKTQQAAEQFGEICLAAFRQQLDEWLSGDFRYGREHEQ